MDLKLPLSSMDKPEDVQKLIATLSEMAEQLDIMYTETAPNGTTSARRGRIALYKNGADYEKWINVDGATAWERVDHVDPLQTGDWIVSSVTTARTGWTNKSATYSNKFMRINATPLTTGGADTHSHTLAEANLPAHTHAAGTLAADSDGAHTHNITGRDGGAGSNPSSAHNTGNNVYSTDSAGAHTHTISGSTASVGSGTSFSGDNVPAYVQVVIFEKD